MGDESNKEGGAKKDRLDKIRSWINSPKGKKELDKAYKCTKKVVDDLVESRYVGSEILYRPFNK